VYIVPAFTKPAESPMAIRRSQRGTGEPFEDCRKRSSRGRIDRIVPVVAPLFRREPVS
jgi:hypothetical protein